MFISYINELGVILKMMRMRISIIILLVILTSLTNAQESTLEKFDCTFNNERIDSINFNKIINSLDSIVLGYKISQEEHGKLLDCLFSFNSTNPKLFWHKAIYMESTDLADTVYFEYYRYCIKMNYKVAYSYYNIGVNYINFMFFKNEYDSIKIFELTNEEKTKLFKLAEKNLWLSYQSGLKEAIFPIGVIQKLKNEHLNIALPILDVNQDTIKITVKILDCGEFGGHFETINIIRSLGEYTAIFQSDSIFCQNEKPQQSENSKYNSNEAELSKELLSDLIHAISFYKDNGSISNAPFEIAVSENKNVIYQRIEGPWTFYLDFRKNTFGF